MVEQLYEWLATAGINGVKWGERKHVTFDNSKEEMIAFTRQRKADLQKRLAEAQITVSRHTKGFNVEATIWLRMYLDTGLKFRTHKNMSLEKVNISVYRVRRLKSTSALEPGLIRPVQMAPV